MLPAGDDTSGRTATALRFFGVDERSVASLRTATALARENRRLDATVAKLEGKLRRVREIVEAQLERIDGLRGGGGA